MNTEISQKKKTLKAKLRKKENDEYENDYK